ncbi:MAG: FAD-dependent oxidoreductase, partial [Acidimicrobiales bacterium]
MSPAGRGVEEVDAVVLGLGPGGEDVAGRLAGAGLSVVAIDQLLVGGECPYWGCVPSKAMVRAADLLAEVGRAGRLSGESSVVADWAPVAGRVRELTAGWDDAEAVERLEAKGATFVRGHGRLVGPREVAVGDRTFRAGRALVLATGCQPVVPPVPGLDGVPFWTNRQAIECEHLPGSMVVLGGGAVGLELAQVFARFGTAVSVVEAAPRLLAGEEPESSELLGRILAGDGIELHTGVSASSARLDGRQIVLRWDGGGVAGERLLVAAGRRPDLAA